MDCPPSDEHGIWLLNVWGRSQRAGLRGAAAGRRMSWQSTTIEDDLSQVEARVNADDEAFADSGSAWNKPGDILRCTTWRRQHVAGSQPGEAR